jgi:hypothetical protein
LICVDGCTNILIRVIIMVFELMRSQILLEFAVCNLHTRKMKSINDWKDEDSVVRKKIYLICLSEKKLDFICRYWKWKYCWQKEFLNYLNSNWYYLICLLNNFFVLGHESCNKSLDIYKFLELCNFYFVVLSLLENIHIN